jgi:DNA-binding MarR family transcriptional regulator
LTFVYPPSINRTAPAGATRLSEVELGAWYGFLRVHSGLIAELDRELEASHGIALRSYEVLLRLAQAQDGRLRMSELADAVVLSRSGLTRLVDRLESQGHVERHRCPSDARGAHAVITEAGMERLRGAADTHVAAVRRLFVERFSEPELRTMAGFWRRLDVEGPSDRGAPRSVSDGE